MDIATFGSSGQVLPAAPDAPNPKWLVEDRELIRSVQSIDLSEMFGEGHELTFALDPTTKRPVVRVVNHAESPRRPGRGEHRRRFA